MRAHTPKKSLPIVLALALAASAVDPAGAQDARGAQFVLVIDDSGSMDHETQGFPGADPDRLAVFAARSLVHMLDDGDQVSLVRLNASLEGQSPPPVQPLAHNRQEILGRLANEGELARYAGKNTPCGAALAQVADLLEAAYRPGLAQVVLFLTDGACTDQAPDPQGFLQRLRSHRDGLFRFYLLRFQGRPFTPALERLAAASGGQAIAEVSASDPTSILEPFADALTRSQGYEAEVLTPDRFELAAHRGARRVRLLAVAPGDGPDLGFDFGGSGPQDDARAGMHRYQNGRVYRFAALDYRPGATPVRVQVTGAGRTWKVVAVPEYRLFVATEIREGTCDDPGERLEHGVETGATVCVMAWLEGDGGEEIAGDVTGGCVQAVADFHLAEEEPKSYPMNPLGERTARYGLERRGLERGSWRIQPVIRIELADRGRQLELRAGARSLQAASIRIDAVPASVDFGSLLPGSTARQGIAFKGNFSPAAGRLELADRAAVPSCVVFGLNDKVEGEAEQILDGQPCSLSVSVASYCGPESFQASYESSLRLTFDQTGGLRLPTVEIPVRLSLAYRIDVPPALDLALGAGETRNARLDIGGNQARPLQLTASIDEKGDGWPERHLELGFVTAEDERAGFELATHADACCADGTYRARIVLGPAEGALYRGEPPAPVVVPVNVTVRGSKLWSCRGPLVLTIAAVVLALLLLAYLFLMFYNSSFLSPQQLARSLVPLSWGAYGEVVPRGRTEQQVALMVRRGMTLPQRALAWLKANPLVFGLPGRTYHETVELALQPELNVERSTVTLLAERDHFPKVQAEPESAAGRLFAAAHGRNGHHFFYAVLQDGWRIGRLAPERLLPVRSYEESEEGPKSKTLTLKRREKLIHAIEAEEREEGRPAGWQVG